MTTICLHSVPPSPIKHLSCPTNLTQKCGLPTRPINPSVIPTRSCTIAIPTPPIQCPSITIRSQVIPWSIITLQSVVILVLTNSSEPPPKFILPIAPCRHTREGTPMNTSTPTAILPSRPITLLFLRAGMVVIFLIPHPTHGLDQSRCSFSSQAPPPSLSPKKETKIPKQNHRASVSSSCTHLT